MRPRRAVAKRPEPRTIEVAISEGDFEGWWALVRVDFPAALLEDIQSDNATRFLAASAKVIVEHNFPGTDGALAKTLADVDPYDGLVEIMRAFFDAKRSLPPR